MNATGVTAGPAETNGSLLLGIWRDSLHVTCGLTACTPGSAPGPTLGNEYGKTCPLYRPTCTKYASQPISELDGETKMGLSAINLQKIVKTRIQSQRRSKTPKTGGGSIFGSELRRNLRETPSRLSSVIVKHVEFQLIALLCFAVTSLQ